VVVAEWLRRGGGGGMKTGKNRPGMTFDKRARKGQGKREDWGPKERNVPKGMQEGGGG